MLVPDYPGAPGRTGYAVGLDVPASVLALLDDLGAAGYVVRGVRRNAARLARCARLPAAMRPHCSSATRSLARRACRMTRSQQTARRLGRARGRSRRARRRASGSARTHSAISWSRCRPTAAARASAAPTITIRPCRRATRWSPSGCGCSHVAKVDALVHMGAHGTLEWLPGKAVALTSSCFPEAVDRRAAGHLSVHRQQSGRGRAGQAPHRRGDDRASAAAARRRRALRRGARARAAGRRIRPGRRARPPAARTPRRS